MNSNKEVQILGFGKFYPHEQKVQEGVSPQAEEKILARGRCPHLGLNRGSRRPFERVPMLVEIGKGRRS